MKITFNIEYHTEWGESIALVLEGRKHPMQWVGDGKWSVSVETPAAALKDYTYVVMKDGLIVRPEFRHHSSKSAKVIDDSWIECDIPGCPFPRAHSAEIFDQPGFRGAGVAVPIFSLRSSADFGIGEFRDLHALVDWVSRTGQCIIQLLPINDTTRNGGWEDSYPYSPITSFALHPLYIHLQDLGIEETQAFRKLQQELNDLPEIDYPRVYKEKMALVRKAFLAGARKDMESKAYQKFYKENAFWLEEYAAFCANRDNLEPEYYCWMQWHLDRQLSEEVAYAHKKGVYLKGDLPIGVSRDSADAYYHPELFNLDSNAGAPPDFFSANGQNWGFPTYNWEAMAADEYAWWKSRLKKMSQYFDAFRIDHILGFFRIWEIPAEHKIGLLGHFNPCLPYSREEIDGLGLPIEPLFLEDPRHPGMLVPKITPDNSSLDAGQHEVFGALYNDFFYHRHNSFWGRNAAHKLPELLGASGMLACGEDLGMVPDCVPGVMDHEKILSLEMQMMEKGRPWPEMSVCATSSHDMETMRMQYAQSHDGADMPAWEAKRKLWEHLASASMLAVFPLQDWVAIDGQVRRREFMQERINEPSDSAHHWRFRFHRNIAELLDAKELNLQIEGLLKDSRRYQA